MVQKSVAFLLMAIVVAFCSCQSGESSFLEDQAGILTDNEKQKVVDYNEVLLSELDIHFKLIILGSAADNIDQTAAVLFGELGSQTGRAKGLLYLVDPFGEQVRIEVGYDLEQVFTDSFTGFVEDKQMVPFFERGKVGVGVLAATELFVSRMIRAVDGHAFDPGIELADLSYYSGGGGAKTAVIFGSKELHEKPVSENSYTAQSSPGLALKEYMKVLQRREKDPNLALFTPETRGFFSKWVVTDAQQANELHALEKSGPGKTFVSGDLAVIRFPVEQRTQAPYFLQKGPEGWMLDFWTMTNVIRMNHKNMWFFQ